MSPVLKKIVKKEEELDKHTVYFLKLLLPLDVVLKVTMETLKVALDTFLKYS